jgi:hypothetical protein
LDFDKSNFVLHVVAQEAIFDETTHGEAIKNWG